MLEYYYYYDAQESVSPGTPGTPADESGPMIVDSEEEEEEEADSGPYHKNYVTTRYMTKYERARILGTRALQIRLGDCSHVSLHMYLEI